MWSANLVVVSLLHGGVSLGVVPSQHEALGGGLVEVVERFVVGGQDLCEEHPPGAVGVVDVAAVEQEVREDDDLSRLGDHGGGALNGVLLGVGPVEVLVAAVKLRAEVLEHAELVGAGVDAEAAVLGFRGVDVEEHGDHGVVLVGEVVIVLVHQVGCSLLGGLVVGLGVVEGDPVGAHDVLQGVQQTLVHQDLGEDARVHLQVVY